MDNLDFNIVGLYNVIVKPLKANGFNIHVMFEQLF